MPAVRLHSRIHPLSVPEIATPVYLLREDETGFAVAGGKRRKFGSLVPWLQAEAFEQVVVIGSLHSNNVLAAAQFLLEAGIQPILFLKQAHFEGPGNAFFTELLIPRSEWQIVEAKDWPQVESLAHDFARTQDRKTFVLPEGAFCPAAFQGCTGLGLDIAAGEAQLGIQFERIFIDAGTGLSAAGLLYGSPDRNWQVEVVGMAMEESEFRDRLDQCRSWLDQAVEALPWRFHRPQNARSFGAVNQTVLRDILAYARRFGILTDPIYTAKLFRESFRLLEHEAPSGPVLIVHSGGGSSISGFYERLRPLL